MRLGALRWLLLGCLLEAALSIYPAIHRFLQIRADPERWLPSSHAVYPLFNASVAENTSHSNLWANVDKLRDASLWYYTGILRNPVTGNEIVGIEGLELVQKIVDKNSKCNSYWSRKVFVYTDLGKHVGNDTIRKNVLLPLKYYRVKPTSPRREVNSVSLYNEIIVVDKNMTLVTMPSNRNIVSNKFMLQPIGGNIGYSMVHFIRGGKLSKSGITIPQKNSNMRNSRIEKLFNNKWVSFTSPNSNLHGRSQEYYTISTREVGSNFYNVKKCLHKPIAYIQYKRYGECPPWYSLGKACTTELSGYKYNNIRHIPMNVLELITKICPEFYPTDIISMHRNSKLHKGLCNKYKSQADIHRQLWFNSQHDSYYDYNWMRRIKG